MKHHDSRCTTNQGAPAILRIWVCSSFEKMELQLCFFFKTFSSFEVFYACRGHYGTSAKYPSSNYSSQYLLGNEPSSEYSADNPSVNHPSLGYPGGVPEINQMATPPNLYGS